MIVSAVVLALSVAGAIDSDPAFQDAEKLYKSLEYEQAILRFEEIAVRPSLTPPDKAQALLWLGLSYAGTADFKSARRYLKDALANDPQITLPVPVAPRVATLFHDLKAEAAADATPLPPPPPPPPAAGSGTGLVAGAVAGGAGILALVGGAACAGLAVSDFGHANDKTAFQVDAKAALDAANTELVCALVLAPAGAILTGVGATLFVVNSGD